MRRVVQNEYMDNSVDFLSNLEFMRKRNKNYDDENNGTLDDIKRKMKNMVEILSFDSLIL